MTTLTDLKKARFSGKRYRIPGTKKLLPPRTATHHKQELAEWIKAETILRQEQRGQ